MFVLCAEKSRYHSLTSIRSLPVLAHAQDLHHADEDVDEIELKADTLVDDILLDEPALRQASVVEDLLHVVEGEATEDGKSTVQPDALGPEQGAGGGSRENHGGETGESDNGDTGEERATEVHVLLLLGSGAHESDRAHHANSVETSASEDSRVEEHHGSQQRALGEVESGPHAILHHVASRR